MNRNIPLKRSGPPERRTPLRRVPPRPAQTRAKRSGFTPASKAQREKVKLQGCRLTAEHGQHVHPAHVTPRGIGGCDDAECVIGLRADLHRLYDMGQLDILPYLTHEEQAHAASHLGLVGALERTTNERWSPVERAA